MAALDDGDGNDDDYHLPHMSLNGMKIILNVDISARHVKFTPDMTSLMSNFFHPVMPYWRGKNLMHPFFGVILVRKCLMFDYCKLAECFYRGVTVQPTRDLHHFERANLVYTLTSMLDQFFGGAIYTQVSPFSSFVVLRQIQRDVFVAIILLKYILKEDVDHCGFVCINDEFPGKAKIYTKEYWQQRNRPLVICHYDASQFFEPITCPVCLEEFNLWHRIDKINCGHIFCKPCINLLIKKNTSQCPSCRDTFFYSETANKLPLFAELRKFQHHMANLLHKGNFAPTMNPDTCGPLHQIVSASIQSEWKLYLALLKRDLTWEIQDLPQVLDVTPTERLTMLEMFLCQKGLRPDYLYDDKFLTVPNKDTFQERLTELELFCYNHVKLFMPPRRETDVRLIQLEYMVYPVWNENADDESEIARIQLHQIIHANVHKQRIEKENLMQNQEYIDQYLKEQYSYKQQIERREQSMMPRNNVFTYPADSFLFSKYFDKTCEPKKSHDAKQEVLKEIRLHKKK